MSGLAAGVEVEAEDPLLGAGDPEPSPTVELEHLAGALVEQHVAAGGFGMLGAQPGGADLAAGLLVGDEQQLQRAAGGPPAGAGAGRAGDRLGCDLVLHVERAAAPQVAVGDLTGPGIVGPVGRIGEDRVDVAEQTEHRTVVIAAQGRDQVRTVLVGREQPRLEPGSTQIPLEVLDRGPLVAGRVDRVELDQLRQQLDRIALKLVARHVWRTGYRSRRVASAPCSGSPMTWR